MALSLLLWLKNVLWNLTARGKKLFSFFRFLRIWFGNPHESRVCIFYVNLSVVAPEGPKCGKWISMIFQKEGEQRFCKMHVFAISELMVAKKKSKSYWKYIKNVFKMLFSYRRMNRDVAKCLFFAISKLMVPKKGAKSCWKSTKMLLFCETYVKNVSCL